MNWKTIGIWTLSLAAVSGTAWFGYKVYKAYKDIYGNIDEQAREEVEGIAAETHDGVVTGIEESLGRMIMRDKIAPLQKYWGYDLDNLSEEAAQHIVWVDQSEEEEDPDYFNKIIDFNDKVVRDDIIATQEEEDRLDLERLTIKDVELEMLKYDVNSYQALEQYNEMILVDFDRGSDEWYILRQMLDEPVLTNIPKDQTTVANIIERRREFFGLDSKWTNMCTWGEVLIYYGSRASRDLPSESYMDYVENWVIDMDADIDDFESFIEDLNNVSLWYNGVYGLFSIDDSDAKIHCMNYGFEDIHSLPLETQYQIWLTNKLGI